MISIQAKIAKKILRLNPYNWAKGTIEQQRSKQEKSTRFLRASKEIRYQPLKINDITAEWITSSTTKEGIILYLHGGAYALGSINGHREYLSRLALTTQLKVLAINYRLAPEHPFPAALEDSLAAYNWLLSQGFASTHIVIAGDSAGGGLALATLISIRDAGQQLPAGAFCISPWVDLTLTGQSINRNAKPDLLLNPTLLKVYAKYYAGDRETSNPLISPLYADLIGLPPIQIHVGTDEILMDDSVRFTEKALQAGIKINLTTWDGMFHVFQLLSFLPETQDCMKQISSFVSRVLQTG